MNPPANSIILREFTRIDCYRGAIGRPPRPFISPGVGVSVSRGAAGAFCAAGELLAVGIVIAGGLSSSLFPEHEARTSGKTSIHISMDSLRIRSSLFNLEMERAGYPGTCPFSTTLTIRDLLGAVRNRSYQYRRSK